MSIKAGTLLKQIVNTYDIKHCKFVTSTNCSFKDHGLQYM